MVEGKRRQRKGGKKRRDRKGKVKKGVFIIYLLLRLLPFSFLLFLCRFLLVACCPDDINSTSSLFFVRGESGQWSVERGRSWGGKFAYFVWCVILLVVVVVVVVVA